MEKLPYNIVPRDSVSPILLISEYISLPTNVSASGITADPVTHRKVVTAGSFLDAKGTVVNDATVACILFHDTDVTNGDQAGTGIIEAVINVDNIPLQPTAAVKTALPRVTFKSQKKQ